MHFKLSIKVCNLRADGISSTSQNGILNIKHRKSPGVCIPETSLMWCYLKGMFKLYDIFSIDYRCRCTFNILYFISSGTLSVQTTYKEETEYTYLDYEC